MSAQEQVIWHDLECGAYDADLPLWLSLAAEHGGPVLDVGAGTGRVSLVLAHAGHPVIALDRDARLLTALEARRGGLPVTTVTADAAQFDLGHTVPLIIVPMQTVQLLGGAEGRAAFLASARRHLTPDGVLAVTVIEDLAPASFEDGAWAPLPDVREVGGTVYASRAVRMDAAPGGTAITWLREVVPPDEARSDHRFRLVLDSLRADTLTAEGVAAGLTAAPLRRVDPTDEYVGSTVVILHG
ncbi:unannotated protein [freshwater metagenome]|uniref:Unannotated protein n=1 Tax=freshwater metagenome TaxID=449393 RepID=A0A6J7I0V4_9ZZZZ|nr:methyltransferase domain-containing protein [Actinomycetota bacterium]